MNQTVCLADATLHYAFGQRQGPETGTPTRDANISLKYFRKVTALTTKKKTTKNFAKALDAKYPRSSTHMNLQEIQMCRTSLND